MKYFPCWLLGFFFLNAALAQNLPDQMYYSEDGHRIITGGLQMDGLYNEDIIRTIELQFEQNNFWTQMENNYDDKIDIPATLLMDGQTYENIGVRFKGQTSYFTIEGEDKKSFNISMDAYEDLDLMGYETLNLNNCLGDPTFLREFVFLKSIRKHIPAAQASFVNLFVNGENWGLYPSIQGLNSEFIREWFLSSEGSRWRADAETDDGPGGGGPGGGPGGGGMWGNGTAALNYLSSDSTEYQEYYTLKKTHKVNAWEDLINTCDMLENSSLGELEESINDFMDLDRTLWFLACENVFADDDSYIHKGRMDYYLYWDAETEKMVPLEYDGNSVMHENGWTPFYNAEDENYPLMNRLFQIPAIRQRYLAHYRTLLNETFNPDFLHPIIDEFHDMIDPLVEADDKKLTSYNAFINGKTQLKNYISNRYNFLSNFPEIDRESPEINNVHFKVDGAIWQEPLTEENVVVNAEVESANGIQKVNLFVTNGFVNNFEAMEMFDDGQHQDGAANDGVYGIILGDHEANQIRRFYVEAIAADNPGTRAYHPTGTEHDSYIYRVQLEYAEDRFVAINEIMASNDSIEMDEAGDYDDWIELFNHSEEALDISGFYLTDRFTEPNKWEIPENTILESEDYLMIWADKETEEGAYHSNFKLSSSGEGLYLFNRDLQIVDEVVYEQQTTDLAFARVPNGTGDFVIQEATFKMSNQLEEIVDTMETDTTNTGLASLAEVMLNISPNPASKQIRLENQMERDQMVKLYDPFGKLIWESKVQDNTMIDVSTWSNGLYFIRTETGTSRIMILK